MTQTGRRKEPARHALASLGVRTRLLFRRQSPTAKIALAQASKLQKLATTAYAIGHELGDSGYADYAAEREASEEIEKLCEHAASENTLEFHKAKSTLRYAFWRGWREGYQVYQKREWK